jgi:nucleotide-binding universal stress UspA family protein
MERFIVVGVDGSEDSKAALRWALQEARLRGAALHVVHGWWAFPELVPGAPMTSEDWDGLRQEAPEFVKPFVVETIGEPDDVEISVMAPNGMVSEVLVEASKNAELLVVGSRGHGGFTGLLLGSVSQQVAQHATCSLVIVRGLSAQTGGVDEAVTAVAARS